MDENVDDDDLFEEEDENVDMYEEDEDDVEEEKDNDDNEDDDDVDEEDVEVEGGDEIDDELNKEIEFKEDIYGRFRDKVGNIVKSFGQIGKYIFLGKRVQISDEKKKIQLERLQKQLKGLVNRQVDKKFFFFCFDKYFNFQKQLKSKVDREIDIKLFFLVGLMNILKLNFFVGCYYFVVFRLFLNILGFLIFFQGK